MNFKVIHTERYFLPVPFARPLSFGRQKVEVLEKLRVALVLEDQESGKRETGWGEVPLNYPWFWPECPERDPSSLLRLMSRKLEKLWLSVGTVRHPLLAASDLHDGDLMDLAALDRQRAPLLAWQVLNAAFDIALYDGAAKLNGSTVYDLFDDDLIPVGADYFFRREPSAAALMNSFRFREALSDMPERLGVWHMVGTLDCLKGGDKNLSDWIREGGISRLKIKLSSCAGRDFDRLKSIYELASPLGVDKYSLDYNGPGRELSWLYDFLLRLKEELPGLYRKICYIEQPAAPGVTGSPEEIARITAEKELLVDEGAGSWEQLYEYYRAGWSGVALKICKSQTSSLLMFALSKVLNKRVTVMDLTNPSLAQIAHVQLAAHMSDDRELESNGIQYCPEASSDEAVVHPGLFTRREGCLDLSSLKGTGYGYRMEEIEKLKGALM